MIQLLADSYSSSYSSSSNGGPGASFWVAYFIFVIATWLVTSWIMSKVFVKAGRPAWAAFVPFYNTWVLFELGGKSGANIFWAFLPIIGSFIMLYQYVCAMLEFGTRFGKSTTFSVFGLVIFSIVGFAILAFGKSTYQGSGSVVSGGYVPPQGGSDGNTPTPPVVPTPPSTPTEPTPPTSTVV